MNKYWFLMGVLGFSSQSFATEYARPISCGFVKGPGGYKAVTSTGHSTENDVTLDADEEHWINGDGIGPWVCSYAQVADESSRTLKFTVRTGTGKLPPGAHPICTAWPTASRTESRVLRPGGWFSYPSPKYDHRVVRHADYYPRKGENLATSNTTFKVCRRIAESLASAGPDEWLTGELAAENPSGHSSGDR